MSTTRGKTARPKTRPKALAKRKRRPIPNREREREPAPFSRILNGVAPKWNHFKQVDYVFWRMAHGITVFDALKELALDPIIFWRIVDGKRATPFTEKYERAKILQARAFADRVNLIAEGRDEISSNYLKTLNRRIRQIMKRHQKNRADAIREFIGIMKYDVTDRERSLIARNKLQIEAAKWIARIADPTHYHDKVDHSIAAPTDGSGEPIGITVQFVDANNQKMKVGE